jgi:hypothetical protein
VVNSVNHIRIDAIEHFLVSVLPHDRGLRFQPEADAAALVDKGTLGGNAPDDILGGQYRRRPNTTFRRPRGLRSPVLNVH